MKPERMPIAMPALDALERADERMRPHGFWAFDPGFEREITHMRPSSVN
ncbi:hypothetical protein [Nonomuraea sp. NPDC049646]